MLKAFKVKESKKELIPAVIHTDNTMRAQSVDPLSNPLFHETIRQFKDMSGIPALLNTSFNLDSEPIVCSPYDAIRSFLSSSSNHMAIGNFLVSKR